MNKTINFNNFVPFYHQLRVLLKEKIESGEWMSGDKIPSENDLINQYEVSRNTVIKALDELVQDGILRRIQGKGTFVSRPKLEQSLTGFYSFSKVIETKGMAPKDFIISIEDQTASLSVAKHLKIAENDEVIQLKRLRCANSEPIILETSYMPKSIIYSLSKEKIEKTSLYDHIQKEYGIIVKSAKEIFEPVLIRDYESNYLEVEEGAPALLLDRIAYDIEGKPIEFCRSIVRGDRCRFYTELI